MESSTADALPAIQEPPKYPGLAWILSLLMPGAGHLYCGYRKRALYTFLAWLTALLLLRVGSGALGFRIWYLAFRVELVLYIFAPVDAYLSAHDAHRETAAAPYESPRIAAVLNLLTNGLGYWYLGERKKAWTVFICLGLFSAWAQGVKSHTLRSIFFLADEAALLFIAWDAFRDAKHPGRQSGRMADSPALLSLGLSDMPASPLLSAPQATPAAEAPSTSRAYFQQAAAPQGIHPAFPIGFACLLGAGYITLAALGIAMPNYRQIDQSHAWLVRAPNGDVYRNPEYGVQVTFPLGWDVAAFRPRTFIAATSPDLDCSFRLTAAGSPPFESADQAARQATLQFSNLGLRFRLIGRRLVRFGNLHGLQELFSIRRGNSTWTQGLVFAKRGLSMYLLSTSSLDDGTQACQDALTSIRRSVKIGKR